MRAAMIASQTRSKVAMFFEPSPGGTTMAELSMPAEASDASAAARCALATFSSVTITVRAPGRSALVRAPSEASSPRPMTMS